METSLRSASIDAGPCQGRQRLPWTPPRANPVWHGEGAPAGHPPQPKG